MNALTEHDLYICRRRMPDELAEMMKKQKTKLIIAGGFLRSCILSEKIADIDVFCGDSQHAAMLASQLCPKGKQPYKTENAITIKLGLPVQFITRWTFDTPQAVVESFDFTIASAAMWWDEAWRSVCDESFYADLAAKRLIYRRPIRNEDAGGSMLRVLKFYQRGYRIPLDSLGAVIARLIHGMNLDQIVKNDSEAWTGRVLLKLLREVDPLVDPDHIYHLPSMTKGDEEREAQN